MTTSLTTPRQERTTPASLDEHQVQRLVHHWLRARDEGRPPEEVLRPLAGDGLVVHFSQIALRGRQQFRDWYIRTKRLFPRERHEVEHVEVRLTSPLHAEVALDLRWQLWGPHTSDGWIGVKATQHWSVVLRDGSVRLRTLAMDDVHLLNDSAPLDRIS
jgi:hypothetical protein